MNLTHPCMQEWYIKKGFQFKGPLSCEELKHMHLAASTKIWHKGLADWTAADEIEELKGYLMNPSDNPQRTTNNPVSYRAQKRKISMVIVTVFTIVILLAMVYVLIE